MDSRYRKFLALADTGSFSAAARQLRVTQPAISLAVASLEHGLGVHLYIRRSKPLALTREGEVVADATRSVVVTIERMQASLQQSMLRERYHVGMIDSIAHLLYRSEAESEFLAGLEVMVDNSRQILRDLSDGKVDFGVITGQPTSLGNGLATQKLHDETFVFVAAPDRVPDEPIDRIDNWLATDPNSTTYRHFLQVFKRNHLQVTSVFHSASMELLSDMARAGRGTALLPRHFVQAMLDAGTLQLVPTQPMHRPIWLVSRVRLHDVHSGLTTQINRLLA